MCVLSLAPLLVEATGQAVHVHVYMQDAPLCAQHRLRARRAILPASFSRRLNDMFVDAS